MQLTFLAVLLALAATLLASGWYAIRARARSLTPIRQDHDMNNETSGNRGRRQRSENRRASGLAVGLAAIALLAAACGSSSSSAAPAGSAAAAGESIYQQAVSFTHCMRSHGEPAYPDPTRKANGAVAFKITPASRISTNSAQYQSAYKACQKLLPTGRTGIPPALLRKEMSALLKHSQCMRSHGITNFPDPVSNGKGISIPLTSGIDPGSQQFQSAQQACQSLMPGSSGAP